MIPYITIRTEDPVNFYSSFEMDEEDINAFISIYEEGGDQEALDLFMSDYMNLPASKYQKTISGYMGDMDSGPMRNKDQDHLIRNISLLSLGLTTLLTTNFNVYLKKIYGPEVFASADLEEFTVKTSILKDVISEFEQLISNSMSQTQSFVLGSIRTLQREMLAENLLLRNSKITGEVLEAEIKRFKDSLRIKYPDIYSATKNGKILASRKFGPDGETVRHYKFDYYVDLATRTTLLNCDRTTNVIMATANDEKVVEYYLSDPREVKQDRVICQEILNTKVQGVSLLALDEETAIKLGIMTVDEAKSTPDYACGPYCRHSMKRCSFDLLKKIDWILGGENGN
jgi:hypothetical protein